MPSDNFSRPTGGRKPLRKKKPPKTTHAPVTDVQSSGSDYGTKKAKAFKKTPEYKKAVKVAKTAKRRQDNRKALIKAINDASRGVSVRKDETMGLGGALDSAAGTLSSITGKGLDVVNELSRPALAVISGGVTETPLVGKKVRDLVNNATHDVVNLPIQAIPSAYHVGDKVAQGKLKEAGEMLAQPYKDLVNDPKKAFSEHPVNSVLLVSGLKSAGGRGAGAVLRKIPATRPIAATERAPKTLPGTPLKQPRTYSRDVTTKAVQVANEKRKVAKAKKLRKQADRVEERSVQESRELRDKAARVDPRRIQAKEIRKRVDERVAATEDVRRANRSKVVSDVREIVKPAWRGGVALNLIAQNITKASKDDLRAYVTELEAEFPRLGKAGQQANKSLRQELQKAINDRRYDPGVVEIAARKYAEYTRPLQEGLVERALLDKDQAEKARLIPYAVRHMGAKHDGARLLDADGEPLSVEAIRAHMREHNVSEPAFISQAPNARGARNFYQASHEAPKIASQVRTGEATRGGTFDAHPETLVEAAARAQGLKDAADGFGNFVKEVGHVQDGKLVTFSSKAKADAHARDINAGGGGVRYRAIRINPWGASKEQLQALIDQVDSESAASHKEIVSAIEDAVEGKPGPGAWALVPEAAAKQLAQHMRVIGSSSGGKVAQAINTAFRKTVLSMSPKWLAGNVIEAGLRTAVAGAGPRSYMTGRQVLRRLDEVDPVAATELRARTVGGGHFSMAERQHVHRDFTQFQDTALEGTARALGRFWRTPGPREAAALWHGWTEFVFKTVNTPLESQFQTAMLGKAVRGSELMDRQMVKLGKKAVDEAAKGLRNTDQQVAFARAVDRMYGRYSKFSPGERRMIALYTPFVAWTLNAVRFVYDVLPRDHPILTSLIASAEQASDEWLKDQGLDLFIEGALPGFLQGSIPTKDGGHLRLSRFTPFGAFNDFGETATGAVLPQYSGVEHALNGEDWKGKPLMVDGKPANQVQKWGFALQAFMEATVPAMSQAKNIATGDGPLLSRLRQQYDPFKAVAPKKTVRKVAPSSNGWGDPAPAGSSAASEGWG